MKFSPLFMRIERKLGAIVLKFLSKTIRYEVINKPADDFRCIFMCWHRDVLLMFLHRLGSDACAVISASQDGELIAGPVEELGVKTVRGSTTRQGSQAYRAILKMAKERQLAITPDGPNGPAKVIQPGVVHIAFMAKIPIITVALQASREWVFNSWDKFRLPKPFCRITAIYAEPFYINDKADLDTAPAKLSEISKALEKQLLTSI
jgi:lysophospholipid acyltransferase (LPLAT)-like uncharacterized protein